VEYGCNEVELRWLEGVVTREVDLQDEHATLVRSVLRPEYCGSPVEEVVADRCGMAIGLKIGEA